MAKPTSWRKALPLAKAVYAQEDAGRVGCCLHIMLDDGNIEDDHVDYCIQSAAERQHGVCLVAAGFIRTMSLTQRGKLYGHYHEYANAGL